jgi:hypothetical protein
MILTSEELVSNSSAWSSVWANRNSDREPEDAETRSMESLHWFVARLLYNMILSVSPAWRCRVGENVLDSWATIVDCGDAPLTWLDNNVAFKQLDKSHRVGHPLYLLVMYLRLTGVQGDIWTRGLECDGLEDTKDPHARRRSCHHLVSPAVNLPTMGAGLSYPF